MGEGRDLVYKNGACVQAIGINICIVYISLSVIGRLVGSWEARGSCIVWSGGSVSQRFAVMAVCSF